MGRRHESPEKPSRISSTGKNPFADLLYAQLHPDWVHAAHKRNQWIPNVDFCQKDGVCYVKIDLPGIKKEDIIVDIDENLLSISGKRESDTEDQDTEYYLNELPSGYFSRCLQLPGEVQGKNVKANYEEGVLTLILPPQDIKKKKIDIL